jgi:hypothetical protein
MKKRATIYELTIERLILREPNDGRVRAVLETCGDGAVPGVRLSLLDARGEPKLVAEIVADGAPVLHVGHPDCGVTVTISPESLDCWSAGNIVASVRSSSEGGVVEVADGAGRAMESLGTR